MPTLVFHRVCRLCGNTRDVVHGWLICPHCDDICARPGCRRCITVAKHRP